MKNNKKNVVRKKLFVALSMLFFCFAFINADKNNIYELMIKDTYPSFITNDGALFKVKPEVKTVFAYENETEVYTEETTPISEYGISENDILGIDEAIYQPETDIKNENSHGLKEDITIKDIDKILDFDYLKSKFYVVDQRTDLEKSDINVQEFLKKDLTINKENMDLPKVLVFHTHSTEGYSNSKNLPNDGVFAVGDALCDILDKKYQIKSIHHKGRFDIVDGGTQIYGAYDRMAPAIKKILKDNPSIEIVIDMHRDGVPDDRKLVTKIDGKDVAKIMFVNGLSKTFKNEKLSDIEYLQNKNKSDNLTFSFRLQLLANELFPDLTRKIYINAFRYSLYLAPKTILLEVGAQTNTIEEAKNSMEPFAEILAGTVLS